MDQPAYSIWNYILGNRFIAHKDYYFLAIPFDKFIGIAHTYIILPVSSEIKTPEVKI